MTGYLAGLLALLVLLALGAAFLEERRNEKKLKLQVEKLYASQLFADMTPFIKTLQKYPAETLSIDKTGVTVRYFRFGVETGSFLMRSYGYAYLTDSQQEALRVVLEECVKNLADREHYNASRKRIRLLNGDVEYAFRYTMTSGYKALLTHSVQHSEVIQPRLW